MRGKKRSYAEISPTKIERAVVEVESGSSQREIALKYGIPRGTLQNRLKKKHTKQYGRPTILSASEEDAIVEHVIIMAKWGFPVDHIELRMLVKTHLDKLGREIPCFESNYPGLAWFRSFMKRHKDVLSPRICQNIAPKRAQISTDNIKEYFSNLKETLKNIPPSHIVNYDETNLSDDPGRKRCIYPRGCKYPERMLASAKSAISLMFAGTACGHVLPPYVVYKAEHLWDTWTTGGPTGARYGRSKSGWFDTAAFEDWFKTIALPYFRKLEGDKVLLGDNLSSHINEDVINLCAKHNIKFVCLPPNATHICQPLDVAFFRPLKMKWRQILSDWKKTNRSALVSKDCFPSLLRKLMTAIESGQEENLKAGFRKCGIVPFSPDAVLASIPDEQREAVLRENVSETFINHLADLRNTGKSTSVRKKKRLNIAPGKSFADITTDEDTHGEESEDEDMQGDETRDVDTEQDVSSPIISDSECEESGALVEGVAENNTSSCPDRDINEGDYVLVKYTVGGRCKSYVGKVITSDEKSYLVMFMRKVRGTLSKFQFPDVADTDAVDDSKILLILPAPHIHRGSAHSAFVYLSERREMTFEGVSHLISQFTSTQLLIISCIILGVLLPLLGKSFGLIMVGIYTLAHRTFNLNLKGYVSMFVSTKPTRRSTDYLRFSGAQKEVENIKCLISKSFILSWTRQLGLDERTELDVIHTADTAIDRLLQKVTNNTNIYHLINDLIMAAHLHIQRYEMAKIEPVKKKKHKEASPPTMVVSRFIDISQQQWSQSHPAAQYTPRLYLKSIIEKLIITLLDEKPCSLTLEALSNIISENVLGNLLEYLSQQENLLKIIIRVFSDDFEELLQTAELERNEEAKAMITKECDHTGCTGKVLFTLGTDDNNLETEKPITEKEKHNAFLESPTDTNQSLPLVERNVQRTEDDSPLSPDQFISEELMKYFKVAPSTPHKKPDTTKADNDDKPKTVSMLMMQPAIHQHIDIESEPTDNGSVKEVTSPGEVKVLPMSVMTAATSIPFHKNTFDSDPSTCTTSRSDSPSLLPMSTLTPANVTASGSEVIAADSFKPPPIFPSMADSSSAAPTSLPSASMASTHNPPKVVPMTAMTATVSVPATSVPPKEVPMTAMTAAVKVNPSSISAAESQRPSHIGANLKRRLTFQKAASIESRSYDSGVSDVKALNIQDIEDGDLDTSLASDWAQSSTVSESSMERRGMKIVSISIPSAQLRNEKSNYQQKYTLYNIHYKATYPDNGSPNGCSVRECVVYRRYREFVNLRARLEKTSQFTKILKSIKAPKWWQQLSLTSFKPAEVEKRRRQLELFLMQLVDNPHINLSKDLEEFLAYKGGAEIEFVQEKVEIIPQAARIDKVVIKTMTGVFDKVSDKLSSQTHFGSPESRRAAELSKHVERDAANLPNSLVYNRIYKISSDLASLLDEPELRANINDKNEDFYEPTDRATVDKSTNQDPDANTTNDIEDSKMLADNIFQLLLRLIQPHSDLSKNDKLVSTVNVIFVPLFGQWLCDKIDIYTSPEQVHMFLKLFKDAVWPETEEEVIKYDIEKLRELAVQCILNELPKPVTFLAHNHVIHILDDVLKITEHCVLNKKLGLAILSQAIQHSLSSYLT